jgi:hypothetical protein
MNGDGDSTGNWTLLTGHGHVLVAITRDPDARIRDISAVVGLTDRTVQAIVADLEDAGYLTRTRAGRRTRYTVNYDSLFRHSAQEGLRVGPLLDLLAAVGDAPDPVADGDGSAPQTDGEPAPRKDDVPVLQADDGPAGDAHALQAGDAPAARADDEPAL